MPSMKLKSIKNIAISNTSLNSFGSDYGFSFVHLDLSLNKLGSYKNYYSELVYLNLSNNKREQNERFFRPVKV